MASTPYIKLHLVLIKSKYMPFRNATVIISGSGLNDFSCPVKFEWDHVVPISDNEGFL